MIQTPLAAEAPLRAEELAALNEEIAATIRAGLPLELGLERPHARLRRQLDLVRARLSDRMQGGASLLEAIDAEKPRLPRVYRAVVEAGARAGRLPEALEALIEYSRNAYDMSRRLRQALLYPAIVVVLAFALLVAFVSYNVPIFLETYERFDLRRTTIYAILTAAYDSLPYWAIGIPLAVVILAIIGLILDRRTRNGSRVESGFAARRRFAGTWIGAVLPGFGSVVRNRQRADFTRMLAMLVEHRVPLHDALRLAAASTASAPVQAASERLAAAVEAGEPFADRVNDEPAFPAFMRWTIANGVRGGTLPLALRRLGDTYHRRAQYQAEWIKLAYPLVLVVLIAGSATLLYSLALFAPLVDVLHGLGRQ